MYSNDQDTISAPYEEEYRDYEIYIEENPDPFRDDFDWSVCKDNIEHESGEEYTTGEALAKAHLAVEALLGETENSLTE